MTGGEQHTDWPSVVEPGSDRGQATATLVSRERRADLAVVEAQRREGEHAGQVRMAYRLAADYAGRLLHVPGLGWHVWDGTRWAPEVDGEPTRAVLDVVRRAIGESAQGPDKALRRDAGKCESAAGVRGVLELAGALEGLVCPVDQLDADPYLLNVANGTLDLRTLTLRPHDPADRLTRLARGAWQPEEQHDAGRWQPFLEEVLPDPPVREFVQRLVGVALLGKVVEHVLPIWTGTGTGANGKGVTYGALLHALGDYAVPADPELFMARENAHPTGQMDLRGRRLVVVSESDRDRRLAEATMKRLTGGDPIKARLMRQDFVEFPPSHLAVLVTNHLPKVTGDDEAVWRRMLVVPFEVVVPETRRDPRLPEALELESDDVLGWAVRGWLTALARAGAGCPPRRKPAVVLAAISGSEGKNPNRLMDRPMATGSCLSMSAWAASHWLSGSGSGTLWSTRRGWSGSRSSWFRATVLITDASSSCWSTCSSSCGPWQLSTSWVRSTRDTRSRPEGSSRPSRSDACSLKRCRTETS